MADEDERARAIARHMMAAEGTAPQWRLEHLDGGVGYAKVCFEVTSQMLNGHGTIHGGLIFSLADSAFAYAANSRNDKTVSQQASIVFLGAASVGETLVAEAREQACSGRSGVYDVSVRTADGRDIARFTGLSRTVRGHTLEDS
ncbi:MAG: hydroxyphenylacetyl-CoA thioesterase PaaI [Pseudomonadota bacterium]